MVVSNPVVVTVAGAPAIDYQALANAIRALEALERILEWDWKADRRKVRETIEKIERLLKQVAPPGSLPPPQPFNG